VTKILALLLLIVAGALVYTVIQQRRQAPSTYVSFEPRPVAQRPDDKLGADEQSDDRRVLESFSRSVVHITSLQTRRDRMTLDLAEIPQGTGSGFVWDQDGHIVTNYHVVQLGDRAAVTLNDNTTYPATITGIAPDKDIAVLHIGRAAAESSCRCRSASRRRSRSARRCSRSEPVRPTTRRLTTGVVVRARPPRSRASRSTRSST